MAEQVIIDKSKLTTMGDKIRSKTGGTTNLTVDQMASEIDTLVLPQGNATAANVLKNKTFINDTGALVTGSMTNRGAVSAKISASTLTYKVTKGYHNGNGTVTLPDGYSLVSNDGSSLDSYSWASIQSLVKKGLLDDLFSVGATKTIYVSGSAITATLIGINHDGSNTATFIFTLPTQYAMYSGSNTSGGWGSCSLRSTLNDTVLGTLNSDLQAVLKTVSKVYGTAGGTEVTTTSTSSDKLFIPSFNEISGNSNYIDNNSSSQTWGDGSFAEGSQYAYFKSNNWYIDSRYLVRSSPQVQRTGFIEANENKKWIFWFNTAATVRACFVVG